ncbi:NAD(+) salvage pathway protein [Cadophora gregata f. sp. sojae]|nr:NAD(+) salvage pathway protein [Cadophora gregata f. sp. sojae]
MAEPTFKPALIIVDLQEDFCPPNGSLAVPSGRDIITIINHLLTLPFALKIATKDWHPADHISFASSHPQKKPFADTVTVINPYNSAETYKSRLWPDHCIQDTPGAELVPELDVSKIDKVVEKGMRKEVEMYSAFYDPFTRPRVSDSGLADMLRNAGITHVYVVGLAFDYCVRATAEDAHREGFKTVIVREGTAAVDRDNWAHVDRELGSMNVNVVGLEGKEVQMVRNL